MSRNAPIRRTPNVEYSDRMIAWFDRYPAAFDRLVAHGISRLERELAFEAWYEACRREDAKRRHPSAAPRFGPPKWTPSPDYAAHAAPRSITRDAMSLIRKTFRGELK